VGDISGDKHQKKGRGRKKEKMKVLNQKKNIKIIGSSFP